MRVGQEKSCLLRSFCAHGYYFSLISLVTFLIKQESNRAIELLLRQNNYFTSRLRNSCIFKIFLSCYCARKKFYFNLTHQASFIFVPAGNPPWTRCLTQKRTAGGGPPKSREIPMRVSSRRGTADRGIPCFLAQILRTPFHGGLSFRANALINSHLQKFEHALI